MMAVKMPAKRIATSRIGSQVKPLAARCSSRVSLSEASAMRTRKISRARFCSSTPVPKTSNVTPGRHTAEPRIAAMMSAISRKLMPPCTRIGSAFAVVRGLCRRGAETRDRPRRTSPARSRRRSRSAATDAAWSRRNSTPCRKPTNSGGSPSGVSAPPTLATSTMKKTMTWALWARPALARISGRIRIIAAPVVPTKLAIERAEREDGRVRPRRAAHRAGHQDAAGHGVEREQEHDEAHVFGEHRVHECRKRGGSSLDERDRDQGEQRPAGGDLAVMAVPEFRKQQRPGRDRKQDAGERQRPGPAHCRAVERRRWRACAPANAEGKQVESA